MIGKQYILMSPWHGNNRNFLFRKCHVRTRCNIIDYREGREGSELGRNGGRKREGGRKPSETVASLQLPMIY